MPIRAISRVTDPGSSMNPIQLPLGVRLRDDATLVNFYPGANAVALGYVERLASPQVSWTDELIYLWGGIGVGRSHLLQAACLQADEWADLTLYLPLEQLAHYGPSLLDNLEQADLVCLDNLDAVAGDPQWELALFHLFNRLRDAGRRLLLSASLSPRALPIKLPDLRSRLTLALVFQLHPLSDEDKLRALQLRASRRGFNLPDDVGRFILSRGGRSMTALFDLLEQLDQASLQAQRKLTIPFLKETLNW
ncbi:regulatory inactivation of DnaA Hda protein [Azomonas agilis]|uniref:Regulatory inactivation of DnaA Hda protein n=2 Tax=Azomonas agilis TaxID=116849 RepID=A0A562I129_9GAMM|nr:regulatory inactivation of DnaA Hda protein [Azomonas agilis]